MELKKKISLCSIKHYDMESGSTTSRIFIPGTRQVRVIRFTTRPLFLRWKGYPRDWMDTGHSGHSKKKRLLSPKIKTHFVQLLWNSSRCCISYQILTYLLRQIQRSFIKFNIIHTVHCHQSNIKYSTNKYNLIIIFRYYIYLQGL
jgi:hypothetical protein